MTKVQTHARHMTTCRRPHVSDKRSDRPAGSKHNSLHTLAGRIPDDR